MKTGIIRRVDDLGRVVIPREMRQYLRIKEGDLLEISVEDNKICFECYRPNIIKEFNSIMDTITDFYNGEDKKQVLFELKRLIEDKICEIGDDMNGAQGI